MHYVKAAALFGSVLTFCRFYPYCKHSAKRLPLTSSRSRMVSLGDSLLLMPPHFSHPFSTAVHTTCYSDVLHSLLQCNQYYTEWNRKFGGGTRQADVLAQERRRWSIVSKSSRGLYLLDADLKRESGDGGMHMVPEEEVDYSRRGPGAYQALSSGKLPSSFRGLPVYTSKSALV